MKTEALMRTYRSKQEEHARHYTKDVLSEWKRSKQEEQAAAQAAQRAQQAADREAQQQRIKARQELNAAKLREYQDKKVYITSCE